MRLRITFTKTGSLRYTGHLDLHALWERVVRRAGLPLSYTQGFHPGPKIQVASALPLGFAGRAEIVDMWLDTDTDDYAGIQKRLQAGSPPGLGIVGVEAVDEHGPALQTQVISGEYEVTLLEPGAGSELQQKVAGLLATDSLPRERRGKPYNLRPLIEELTLAQGVMLFMRLVAREGATGRPEEVLDVLGIPFETTYIERTRLILKNGLK